MILYFVRTGLPPPDVTQTSSPSSQGGRQTSQVNEAGVHTPQRGSQSGDQVDGGNAQGDGARWKVSAKIQQLLQTLKRPKKRTLPEFYQDDESFYCSEYKRKEPKTVQLRCVIDVVSIERQNSLFAFISSIMSHILCSSKYIEVLNLLLVLT